MLTRLGWMIALVAVGPVACNSAGASAPPVPVPERPAQTAQAQPPVVAQPVVPAKPVEPPPAAAADALPATPEVTVQIASVTLGEDCGARAVAPRPASEAPALGEQRAAKRADDVAGGPAARMARPACEQTSVQLSLRAGPGAASPSIEIRQVRLTDASGVVLGSLVPRSPMVWSADGAYVPWNQTIEPNTTLSVGYSLSAPAWGKISDRYSKTFRLEVVLAVGGVERAVTKEVRVSAPTIMPPNIAT